QHLRRHHALRRGRAGPDRGLRPSRGQRPVRGAPQRHQRGRGPRAPGRGEAAQRPRRGDDGRRGSPSGGARAMSILVDASTRLIGPNCPGVLSPGKANVGIIPAAFFSEGNVGLVSRSGTLTYQIGYEIAGRGFGNSSIVGIGGDPIVGSDFVDIIALYEQDPETELIVMCGEIGGDAEERTAEYV